MKPSHIIFLLFFLSLLGCQQQAETERDNPTKPLIESQNFDSMTEEGWVASSKIDFVYDESNQPIEEIAYATKGGDAIPSFRTLKSYDEAGNLERSVRERWINETWTFGMRSAYIYNQGKIIQRIDSVAGSNARVTFITYRYDDKGRLETELGLRSVEGNMVNQSKVNYQYDERDLAIQKEWPRWSGDDWINSRKMALIYNDAGHHIQTIRYNWTDEQWVESINYTLQVDESGTRLSELWQRPGESGPEEFTRVTYTYKQESD
ncbi:MAG: hypothetical protein ABJP45_15575 [Cyclobacteriaceae bacterium]